ncbi:zinc finger and BTB domain-containing protein 6-like [Betta splendens]|uniref:Zinc finger and BTB domain-containing protein 6-like n=1 Tax=Betta splendens TaxID=158456 RepID=A0A6P7P3P3_BETSP|nr:zinc finger and BTB domain-containing protein 6-like [Betta splendens]XP_040929078.1 zinc finger and BTB domain-containing protein 6-like [Betta splendens]
MSGSSDTLQFHFSTHGDSILKKMNGLREDYRFCDVTLLLGGPRGSTYRPLHFHGHKVVLAASSDFLRDQFLLHDGQAELDVGVVPSVEVGERLLMSCYTGLLEVPLRELVSYLTAASALQMSQVVEKCAQAVSQYLSPTLALLKVERQSEEEHVHQAERSWPGPNLRNQEERVMVQASAGIQDPEEQGVVVIQSKPSVRQDTKLEGKGLREVREDGRVVRAKMESAEDAACCFNITESEESGGIQPVHTNKLSYQVHRIRGALRCKLCPPAARDQFKGTAIQHEDVADASRGQEDDTAEGHRDEEEMFTLASQLQECGEIMDSSLFCHSRAHLPKSHCPGEELADDAEGILAQRPYLCRKCDRVFQHLESYMGHLKEHRQYLCLVCGKGFSQKSNLTCHVGVHTGGKPFRCPLCHKTFSQKATLQDHFSLHTGEKPHKCGHCAVLFTHKPGLRRHLMEIHGKGSHQNVLEESVH